MAESVEFEVKMWKKLWGADARRVEMFGTPLIVMPFVFHLRKYDTGLQFCPMESWNRRIAAETPVGYDEIFFKPNTIKEDNDLRKNPAVLNYLTNPLLVAQEALHHMIIECGFMQPDLNLNGSMLV